LTNQRNSSLFIKKELAKESSTNTFYAITKIQLEERKKQANS
jgi:hypothetical protein